MDLVFATIADKAVKAILPFLKELSNDEWWNRLLESWINFEVKGPPKSVNFFYFFISFSFYLHLHLFSSFLL